MVTMEELCSDEFYVDHVDLWNAPDIVNEQFDECMGRDPLNPGPKMNLEEFSEYIKTAPPTKPTRAGKHPEVGWFILWKDFSEMRNHLYWAEHPELVEK